ncbi:MAG: YgiQ family radical SAM protein [Chlorobi bacterium]|nr:YgiQ family radical SAM protein [Chlorobiota bacterium]
MQNKPKYNITDWLPTTQKEVKLHNWDNLDVILFSGDAYVDHPSFGPAFIGRIIQNLGLRIAIVPQPNWQDDLRDFKKLGKPNLFFAVTSGCMDSMVNHYTAAKRLRSNDAYTPGGKAGFRPDYATVVYSNILKKLFPEIPVVIGGIEASLRRVTHYDYWSNKLKPSVLIDSKADLLVYGMGEKPIADIVRLMKKGVPLNSIKNVPQTAVIVSDKNKIQKQKKWEQIEINFHEACLTDKRKFAENFRHIEEESNKVNARQIIQKVHNKHLVINPPYPVMDEKEIDATYALPFTRLPHPKYNKKGAIPAFEMIKFSVNSHRGCFGGCSFCTISAHQGKFIASRSEESILKEVMQIEKMPDFKGYISDIGGPSANMYKMKGVDLAVCDVCVRPSCIYPKICKNLNTNHEQLTDLYRKVRNSKGIKKAFIGSGIRYDMVFDEKNEIHNLQYAEELIRYHVSGRLKVAPEHCSDEVLHIMRKPSFKLFYRFKALFDRINTKHNLNQQLIPYFISSHPGSKVKNMADLAIESKKLGFHLEQVQDFTPTPMTVATVIYYSGYHPYTLKKVYTPVSEKDKTSQRNFFFWYKKEIRNEIVNTLKRNGLVDYIKKLQ